jgi:hypothetical protein
MRSVALCGIAGFLAAASGGCAAASLSGQPAVSPTGQVSYQEYGGTAIVSADGRTVTVGQYPSGDCPAAVTPVARESATRVALFLEYVTPGNPPSCPQAAAALVNAHDIRLRQPLGNRKLVDGATGRAIAWISSRLVLRPTFLPAGYALSELIPAASLSRAQSPGPAGCVQLYTARDRPDDLMIVQSVRSVRVPGARPGRWTPVRVRGQPGLASGNQVTWREHGLVDYIASVGAGTSQDGPPGLSTQQLIAIADSAPAYNPRPVPIIVR